MSSPDVVQTKCDIGACALESARAFACGFRTRVLQGAGIRTRGFGREDSGARRSGRVRESLRTLKAGENAERYKKTEQLNCSVLNSLAGAAGIEPTFQVPKTCVLPLDDAPRKRLCSLLHFAKVCKVSFPKSASLQKNKRFFHNFEDRREDMKMHGDFQRLRAYTSRALTLRVLLQRRSRAHRATQLQMFAHLLW